jgi:hypothetical protein
LFFIEDKYLFFKKLSKYECIFSAPLSTHLHKNIYYVCVVTGKNYTNTIHYKQLKSIADKPKLFTLKNLFYLPFFEFKTVLTYELDPSKKYNILSVFILYPFLISVLY